MAEKLSASLAMYDWPGQQAANDRFWAALRAELVNRGFAAPERLQRNFSDDPDEIPPVTLFSQTCGYPYMLGQRQRLRLIATPVYDVAGCEGPYYRSFLLVRADSDIASLPDLRGRRVAYNNDKSQSGYNALRALIAPLSRQGRFFSKSFASGGHFLSMQVLAEGRADVCAVDAVCWALMQKHEAATAARLRILTETAPAPALPFVVERSFDDAQLALIRQALRAVFEDPALAATRAELFLKDFQVLDEKAYEPVLEMQQDAVDLGYPRLD